MNKYRFSHEYVRSLTWFVYALCNRCSMPSIHCCDGSSYHRRSSYLFWNILKLWYECSSCKRVDLSDDHYFSITWYDGWLWVRQFSDTRRNRLHHQLRHLYAFLELVRQMPERSKMFSLQRMGHYSRFHEPIAPHYITSSKSA